MLALASQPLKADRKPATHIYRGNPAQMLMQHADGVHADLLAVNAPQDGPLLGFLNSSVARDLVIGARESVLLARGDATMKNTSSHPIRAVLATDHSLYMDHCVEQLIQFCPHGLEHLTVLTAYPRVELERLQPYLAHLSVDLTGAMERDLEERNRSLVRRIADAFRPLGTCVTSQVSDKPADSAITHVMEETAADLLILGAQGHTLLERLTLGSVSFHQAMTARCSVLVLRISSAKAAEIRLAEQTDTGL